MWESNLGKRFCSKDPQSYQNTLQGKVMSLTLKCYPTNIIYFIETIVIIIIIVDRKG